MVFNGSTDFALAANNPAAFIFATANGTIAGWGPPATPVSATGQSTAITEVDESKAGAVFTGLTWVEVDGAHFGGHVRPENLAADRIDRRLAENQSGKRQVVVAMRERGGRRCSRPRRP